MPLCKFIFILMIINILIICTCFIYLCIGSSCDAKSAISATAFYSYLHIDTLIS